MTKRLNKRRLGRCYELAGYRMMDEIDGKAFENAVPGSVRLVHGTIQRDPYPPNPHAWIRYEICLGNMGEGVIDYGTATMVWEPVGDEGFPLGYFEWAFNAVEHNSYTYAEFQAKTLDTKIWGPWDGDYHRIENLVEVGPRGGRKRLKKVVAV